MCHVSDSHQHECAVAAVVLAAGQGRRFRPDGGGAPKQLALVAGRPMLVAVLDVLDQSRVRDVIVVVNPRVRDELARLCPPGPRRHFVVNDRPDSEMIESVQMGLRAARERSPGVAGCLVCPGDHPCLTRQDVDRCIAAFESAADRIVVATHAGRRGHPIVIPADLCGLVEAWPATRRLNELRELYADRVLPVEADAGALIDVDTPEDLAEAEAFRRSDA
jgi:molybdenum cofactor cytidylyltransferase